MLSLALIVAGFAFGFIAATIEFSLALQRMGKRFHKMVELVEVEHDLESRRSNFESERQHQARPDAGAQSRITDGMGFRPGTLAQWNTDNSEN